LAECRLIAAPQFFEATFERRPESHQKKRTVRVPAYRLSTAFHQGHLDDRDAVQRLQFNTFDIFNQFLSSNAGMYKMTILSSGRQLRVSACRAE
jgi:hypothetical protein